MGALYIAEGGRFNLPLNVYSAIPFNVPQNEWKSQVAENIPKFSKQVERDVTSQFTGD